MHISAPIHHLWRADNVEIPRADINTVYRVDGWLDRPQSYTGIATTTCLKYIFTFIIQLCTYQPQYSTSGGPIVWKFPGPISTLCIELMAGLIDHSLILTLPPPLAWNIYTFIIWSCIISAPIHHLWRADIVEIPRADINAVRRVDGWLYRPQSYTGIATPPLIA